MVNLTLTIVEVDRVIKTLTHDAVLAGGDKLKAEFGEDELDETVPRGKSWAVHAAYYIVESDA